MASLPKFEEAFSQLERKKVRSWYFDPRSAGCDILKEAFDNSKDLLQQELGTDEFTKIWAVVANSKSPNKDGGINAFLDTLEQAQSMYASKKSSETRAFRKARIWLNALSCRIMYYGNVMDVLVQQYPEYASLAWGTFKFLFSAVINQQEVLKKLSKSAAQLADLLPQQKMALILYPTAEMQQAVAWVYASIMKFLHLAVCFYKEGRLEHSIKAIFQPWALRFQDVYDELADRSVRVKELADSAAKAELRDIHLDILDGRKVLNEVNARVDTLYSAQKTLRALFEEKMSDQTHLLSTRYQEIRLDLSQQKQAIDQIHLNQLLSMSIWQKLPSSGECLEYCQSMRRRRFHYSRVSLPQKSQLERWASEPSTKLLAVDGYHPVVQKDFMTDVAGIIRKSSLPVIWGFRFPDHWNMNLTLVDLVRMLVFQALESNPGALSIGINPLTMSHLREATNLQDWIRILGRVLYQLPRIFILLDGDLLSQVTQSDRLESAMFTELLRTNMATSVKIMIPTTSLNQEYIQKLRDDQESVELISFSTSRRRRRSRGRRRLQRGSKMTSQTH